MKAQGKRFLSDRGDEGGSVRWHVSTDKDDVFCNVVDATLYLTDCDRTITLEFDCYKREHTAKRIAKIDGLISELIAFKLALCDAENALADKKTAKFYY